MPSELVGRDAELEQLCSTLGISVPEAGAATDRSAVLLAGDAGVGKTRLLTELRDRSVAEGWLVQAGHCLDFADSALPYLPFSEITGRVARELPDLFDAVAERHPALLRLLPGQRMLSQATDPESLPADQAALFDAVHALAETAGARRPVLLVVEDLHWADQSTRDLMNFLFGRGFEAPVALIASYRSDDLHRRHPLRRQVTVWARMSGVERIQLGPLGKADVRRLVQQLHPDPLPAERVRDIISRSEGNAFFVEELVGAARTRTGRIPEDLAELLLVRLENLDDSAVTVVRAAAVAGRRVSHAALSAVVGLEPAELDAAVREAVEGHVLVPSSDDFYQFRHALLAEAVYDDLLPGERTGLHAAYAKALEDGRANGTAAELARHARLAKDYATALTASLRAGDDARAVGGAEEAAQHYLQALDLWHDTRLPDDADLDYPRLVGLVSDALIAAGHPARALGVVREQLDHLPSDADDEVRGQLLGVLAGSLAMTETREDPLDLTTNAVALVADHPTPARAKVLAVHARMLSRAGRYKEGKEAAMTGLALAERLDMPRLASDIRTTLVGLEKKGGPSESLVQALRSAIAGAVDAGAATTELRALLLLGMHHLDNAEFDEADAAFERATTRGRAEGTPWVPYAAEARWMNGVSLRLQARWDDALAVLDLSKEVAPPIYDALLTGTRAQILVARGDPEGERLARELRPFWREEGLVATTAGAAELEAAELTGDQAAAAEIYRLITDTLTSIWHPLFQARVRLAATTLSAFAQGAARRSATERAADAAVVAGLVDDAHAVLQRRNEKTGTSWGPESRAWESRVEAELLRWRWVADVDPPTQQELVDAWRDTESRFEAFAAPYELATVRATLAEILTATGDPAAAEAATKAALDMAEQLGTRPLLRRLGRTSAPAGAPARARVTLTRRESEILALVAEGRSNGEIGRQLFITTKTVSVHVSNILGKLGAAGRTEAAAIARRDGLLG
ncbi:MAG TPA: AAA family ATPase [Nocardioides sp.]|uniref:helix-turn-helix transcriptional regulator n=1 Tax=Nocardioides sp. TaxID=35761 RepID=UPI002F419263